MIHVSGKDHAGYYPGAKDLLLKLIFNKETGTLYGAQAVGQSGVDKRMDVLATAIKSGIDGGRFNRTGTELCTAFLVPPKIQ